MSFYSHSTRNNSLFIFLFFFFQSIIFLVILFSIYSTIWQEKTKWHIKSFSLFSIHCPSFMIFVEFLIFGMYNISLQQLFHCWNRKEHKKFIVQYIMENIITWRNIQAKKYYISKRKYHHVCFLMTLKMNIQQIQHQHYHWHKYHQMNNTFNQCICSSTILILLNSFLSLWKYHF